MGSPVGPEESLYADDMLHFWKSWGMGVQELLLVWSAEVWSLSLSFARHQADRSG